MSRMIFMFAALGLLGVASNVQAHGRGGTSAAACACADRCFDIEGLSDEALAAQSQADFRVVDRDCDGEISVGEWQTRPDGLERADLNRAFWHYSYGHRLEIKARQAFFHTVDADGNGVISGQEWEAQFAQAPAKMHQYTCE